MIGFAIGFVLTSIWLWFEIWRSPTVDERTGKTIKQGKKLSDLFSIGYIKPMRYFVMIFLCL
jgi:hypothetical protein